MPGPVVVQHVLGTGAATSTFTGVLPSAVTSGNAVVVAVTFGGTATTNLTSVTDDKGNSYTVGPKLVDATNQQVLALAYAFNLTNAPKTITVTLNAGHPSERVSVAEVSGITGADGVGASQQQSNTGSLSSGNVTPAANGEFLFGATVSSTAGTETVNPAGGWSVVDGGGTSVGLGFCSSSFVQTTAAAIAATYTGGTTSGITNLTAVQAFTVPSGGTVWPDSAAIAETGAIGAAARLTVAGVSAVTSTGTVGATAGRTQSASAGVNGAAIIGAFDPLFGSANVAVAGTIGTSAAVISGARAGVVGAGTVGASAVVKAAAKPSVSGGALLGADASVIKAPTVWNPSDLVQVTLSNGNLTAAGNSGQNGGVRSTTSKGTSKWYAEYTITSDGGFGGVGFVNSSWDEGDVNGLGGDNNSVGLDNVGDVFLANAVIANVSGFTTGDTVAIALDLDNGKLWFKTNTGLWNNDPAADPAAGTQWIDITPMAAGPYFIAFGDLGSFGPSSVDTINFGALAFNGTVPSEFKAWDAGPIMASAGIEGTGTVGASASRVQPDASNIVGSATVGTAAIINVVASVTIPGTGMVGSRAGVTLAFSAGGIGVATVGVNATRIAGASAGVSVSATVGASAIINAAAVANIGGTGTVGALGTITGSSAGIGGTAVVGALAATNAAAVANVNGVGSAGAVPGGGTNWAGSAAIAVVGGVGASASRIQPGICSIAGTATVRASAVTNVAAVAAIGEAATVGVNAVRVVGAAAGIGGSATVGTSTIDTDAARAGINGAVVIGASAVVRAAAKASIFGSGAAGANASSSSPNTTWNPADKFNVFLSNSNLTATGGGGGDCGVRATKFHSGGKWQFELAYSATDNNTAVIGIASTAWNLNTTTLGTDNTGIGVSALGDVWFNGGVYASVAGYNVGDTVGVFIDDTNKLIWFRTNTGPYNGVGGADPATGTGGISYAAIAAGGVTPAYSDYFYSDTLTANFGGQSLVTTTPVGYQTWDPQAPAAVSNISGTAIAGAIATVKAAAKSALSVVATLNAPTQGVQHAGASIAVNVTTGAFLVAGSYSPGYSFGYEGGITPVNPGSAISVSATLTATARVIRGAFIGIQGVTTLGASASVAIQSIPLQGVSTVGASASVTRAAVASMPVVGAVSAFAVGTRSAVSSIAAIGTVAGRAVENEVAVPSLAGTVTVGAAAIINSANSIGLAGTVTVGAAAVIRAAASASIVEVATVGAILGSSPDKAFLNGVATVGALVNLLAADGSSINVGATVGAVATVIAAGQAGVVVNANTNVSGFGWPSRASINGVAECDATPTVKAGILEVISVTATVGAVASVILGARSAIQVNSTGGVASTNHVASASASIQGGWRLDTTTGLQISATADLAGLISLLSHAVPPPVACNLTISDEAVYRVDTDDEAANVVLADDVLEGV
jgi:hypothetical protein